MQVCISLQTDNHASTPPLKFFYRPDALPAAQLTASKHLNKNLYGNTGKYKQENTVIRWLKTLRDATYCVVFADRLLQHIF